MSDKRSERINAAVKAVSVTVVPELVNQAYGLCEYFQLPVGTLWRRAAAIALVDSAERITRDALQEAATQLIVKSE